MIALTQSLRAFAHEHDDIPAFHAAFLVATVLTAAVLNLGCFALLICAHMALDFVKYRDLHRYDLRTTLKAMVLESIGDVALFFVALTFAVYLNHTYMLAAVSGMLRSELSLLRMLGTLIPKIRIMENILAIALNFHNYMHRVHPNLTGPVTGFQTWCMRIIALCGVLLVLAVLFFHAHGLSLVTVLAHELVPSF